MTIDTAKFQELLLATEVASPDRDDGPHMRRQYDERRAAFVAHLNAELAAARVAGLLEAAKLAEECVTGLGAAGQIRALAANAPSPQATTTLPAPREDAPARRPEPSKLCYCLGGPNNHQSGCTEGFPSDLPNYEPAPPAASAASPQTVTAAQLDAERVSARAQGLADAARLCEGRAVHWQQQEGSYAAGKKAGALDAAEQIRGLLAASGVAVGRFGPSGFGPMFFAVPGENFLPSPVPREGRALFAVDYSSLYPHASYGAVEVAWVTTIGKMWRLARDRQAVAATSSAQQQRANNMGN